MITAAERAEHEQYMEALFTADQTAQADALEAEARYLDQPTEDNREAMQAAYQAFADAAWNYDYASHAWSEVEQESYERDERERDLIEGREVPERG